MSVCLFKSVNSTSNKLINQSVRNLTFSLFLMHKTAEDTCRLSTLFVFGQTFYLNGT